MNTKTLETGSKAYYDSFSGLIPCKVLSIDGLSGLPSSRQQVRLRITSKRFERYGYRFGEVMSVWGLHVVPRGAVRFRSHSARITPYHVTGSIPTVECTRCRETITINGKDVRTQWVDTVTCPVCWNERYIAVPTPTEAL